MADETAVGDVSKDDRPRRIPSLGWIIGWPVFLFVLLLATYLIFSLAAVEDPNQDHQRIYQTVLAYIPEVARTIWTFIRPFFQLVLILVIVDWLLAKWGISFKSRIEGLEWNVQTVIALMVIGAFSIAALGGIGGADMLKDLALVVVGFYFGTQRSVPLQKTRVAITTAGEPESDSLTSGEL